MAEAFLIQIAIILAHVHKTQFNFICVDLNNSYKRDNGDRQYSFDPFDANSSAEKKMDSNERVRLHLCKRVRYC